MERKLLMKMSAAKQGKPHMCFHGINKFESHFSSGQTSFLVIHVEEINVTRAGEKHLTGFKVRNFYILQDREDWQIECKQKTIVKTSI